MSFVTTQPEALAAAAGNLQAIGSTMSAQAAAIHEAFVNTLTTSAASYGLTEAANAAAAE